MNLHFNWKSPANANELEKLKSIQLTVWLDDFVKLYRRANGGEGLVGEDFIQIWSIDEMVEMNPYYEDSEECKNLMFFATDGSNFGYALNLNSGEIVGIDFLEISNSKPKVVTKNLESFLSSLLPEF